MEIEYCPEKKNPANRPSRYSDYMDAANNKEEKTLYTVGVTSLKSNILSIGSRLTDQASSCLLTLLHKSPSIASHCY